MQLAGNALWWLFQSLIGKLEARKLPAYALVEG